MKSFENNQVMDNTSKRNLKFVGKEIGYRGIDALILASNGYVFTSIVKIGEFQQVLLDGKMYDCKLYPGLLEDLFNKGLVKLTEDSTEIRQKYEITDLGKEVLNQVEKQNFKILATDLYRSGFKVDVYPERMREYGRQKLTL